MNFIWHKTCLQAEVNRPQMKNAFIYPLALAFIKCSIALASLPLLLLYSMPHSSIYQFWNPNTINHKTNKWNKCAAILQCTFPFAIVYAKIWDRDTELEVESKEWARDWESGEWEKERDAKWAMKCYVPC